MHINHVKQAKSVLLQLLQKVIKSNFVLTIGCIHLPLQKGTSLLQLPLFEQLSIADPLILNPLLHLNST